MIINASGRCDIPAFYSEWFINRLKAGFVDVRNPFYQEKITRIPLTKEKVEAIIFCTKNPIPMLKYLDKIPFPYIFQITITPYKKNIEPLVPSKKAIISAVKDISNKIGSNRVIVRYDPIFISHEYSIDYHEKAFTKLCEELTGYTNRIIISFLDLKKNTLKHRKELNLIPFTKENIELIAEKLSQIALSKNIELSTCAEEYSLEKFGISNRGCTDEKSINELLKTTGKYHKSKNRDYCHCIETTDIGAYNCCPHYCKYCYANYQEEEVQANYNKHDPNSSLIIGNIGFKDIIKETHKK